MIGFQCRTSFSVRYSYSSSHWFVHSSAGTLGRESQDSYYPSSRSREFTRLHRATNSSGNARGHALGLHSNGACEGLSETVVLLKHGLRGGIIPVVSYTGPAARGAARRNVVVERIFSIPGLGNIFIQAVLNRDEPSYSASSRFCRS
jgi:hypothetical protein